MSDRIGKRNAARRGREAGELTHTRTCCAADRLAHDNALNRDARVAARPGAYAPDKVWVVPADGVGPGWLAPTAALSRIGAPVAEHYPIDIAGKDAPQVRVKGRLALTLMGRREDHQAAVLVFTELVNNALAYGLIKDPRHPLASCLAVTESRELLINVRDLNPNFPGFQDIKAGRGRGFLSELTTTFQNAKLTWFAGSGVRGKTVRAVLAAEAVSSR